MVQPENASEEDQIKQKISSELMPFISDIGKKEIWTRDYEIFRDAYSHFIRKYREKEEIVKELLSPKEIPTDIVGTVYGFFFI